MAKKPTKITQPVDTNPQTTETPNPITIDTIGNSDPIIQTNEDLTLNIQTEETVEPTTTTETPAEQVNTTEEIVNVDVPVTETVVEEPVIETAAVVEEIAPVVEVQAQDINQGIGLLPNDSLHSKRLEEALATLRSTDNLAPLSIAQAQVALYNTLTHYFQRREFEEVAELVLNFMAYVEQHQNTHFTHTTIFRGFDKLPNLNQAQNMEFRMLLKVLVDLAPEASRAKVAHDLNWSSVHSQWHPDRADKMIGFFQRFLNLN